MSRSCASWSPAKGSESSCSTALPTYGNGWAGSEAEGDRAAMSTKRKDDPMTITINKTTLAAKLALTAFIAFSAACDGRAWSPFVGTALAVEPPGSASARSGTKAAIVLVHGAWADATGWQAVIPLLQQKGYDVIAVENPLISFSTDVQTTKRVIEAKSKLGPVVVVGHSYGGAVMTN